MSNRGNVSLACGRMSALRERRLQEGNHPPVEAPVIPPSRIAHACISLCLTVATAGAQGVCQYPPTERQAAFARPAVATWFVAGNIEL